MNAHPWLALLGVAVVFVCVLAGFAAGTVDRVLDDPEAKAAIERRRAELARQKAWKDRLK